MLLDLGSLTSALAAPFASLTSTLDAPLASLASALASPFASLTSTLDAPLASLASALAAPFASLTSTLAAPLASLASTLAAPFAALASTLAVPLAAVTSALAAPLASLTSTLTAPLAAPFASLAAALAAASVMIASAKRASADDREPDLKNLERAATDGDPEAQYQLSMILKEGRLTKRDIERSTDLLLRAAARERPAAMLELAYRYHDGEGLPKDPGLAARWMALVLTADEDEGEEEESVKPPFRPSPALSDPDERLEFERMLRMSGMDELETSLILADRYAFGEGVEVDLDEAFVHSRLAAELGDVGAALNAGMMLLAGDGTLPDFEEATPLLRRALALEHPQTRFALWHVSTQRPDLVSPEEGLEFLKQAADMSYPAAMATLAGGPPSGDLKLLVQAARRGDLDFVYMLAERYRQGPPEERDQDKAMVLYKRAAKKGELKAARTLQRIYRIGAGVPRNQREADKWRRLGDRLEEAMYRREWPVEEAAKKPARTADKEPAKQSAEKPAKQSAEKPAKQSAEKPAKQPAKRPLEKPAKKPKTASGKKPGEK